jgi:hypothetical protein
MKFKLLIGCMKGQDQDTHPSMHSTRSSFDDFFFLSLFVCGSSRDGGGRLDGAQVLLVTEGAVWGYTVRFASGRGTAMRLLVALAAAASLLVFVSHLDVAHQTSASFSKSAPRHDASTGSRRGGGGSDDDENSSRSSSGSARTGIYQSGSVRQRPVARLPRSTD